MEALFSAVDPFVILFYRLTGYTFIDFLVGTFILAFFSVIIGEFTISLIFLINRKHVDELNTKLEHYQELSEKALSMGNSGAYHATNDLANEAFGKSFFMQIAYSAASLWPAFIAAGWMQHRFTDVEFPFILPEYVVGFMCPFIALYAGATLIFRRIKHKLPYFKRIGMILNAYKLTPSLGGCCETQCFPENVARIGPLESATSESECRKHSMSDSLGACRPCEPVSRQRIVLRGNH